MKKALLFLLFLLNISILLVKSRPIYGNSKRPRIERKNYTKEYYDELFAKGIRLDNLTEGHPPYPYYEKMDYKADKKRRKEILESFRKKENIRKLESEEQTLNNLGFIGLIQNRETSKYNLIMKFITNSIKKDDSRFILYPFPFEYINITEQAKEVPETIKVDEGGVFTLNQTALNEQIKNFELIQNISTVKIGKAKGIYDIDIAILSLTYQDNKGNEQDLFTNANRFCEYFTNQISKTSTCLGGKEAYLEYKQKNPNKGAVVRVSAKDILNQTLYDPETNQLKFKLLIMSDYLTANEKIIFSNNYLTEEAVNILKRFYELGGNIITFGKSGYLLELMEFIDEGTYDNNYIIGTTANKRENPIYGCQEIYKSSPKEQPDFLKQLICLGYKNATVLSETYKMNKVPDNFELLINYTNKKGTLFYKKDGYQIDIEDKDATFEYLLISKEEQNKGLIFIVNGNPEQNFYYFDNIRNIILYSMTKDYIYDLKIKFSLGEEEDLPIPAGEEGIQLIADYKFYNLYDSPIIDFKLEILVANKIKIVDYPSECVIKTEKATKYEHKNLANFDLEQYLLCQSNNIGKLKAIGNQLKIEITDFTITQKLVDIPLLYSNLYFKMNNKDIELNPGIFYAQASIAALLRGTINKDPTSFYPMKGEGLYFDLVLTVENKENTAAKDVKYIAMIPLISPLVDGKDEGRISHLIPVYEKYYKKHNFIYPWLSNENRGQDYIDYTEIAGKGVCYVDDYDTPVKLFRVQRSEVEYEGKINPTTNVTYDENAGPAKGVSFNTLLKQVHFSDAKQFYETAAPRKSLFINTAKVEGAKAYYGEDPIPDDEKDPDDANKAKVHLGFIRLDTYFYTSSFNQYQLPNGFDGSELISLDKFPQDDAEVNGEFIGQIKAKVKNPGHYNSSLEEYKTLKPNEYYNALRQYKIYKQYDPTKPEDLKALQERTNDTIKLTHFMIPNKDPSIKRAGNIYGFEENSDHLTGYFKQYNSIKFIYGHSVELILNPDITRLGGYAEIILPPEVRFNNDDPVEKDEITTSADNVAFYETKYDKDSGIIKLYFRRGLMPNENYGLPSKCKAFFENLNTNINFEIDLNIYELKYDFSQESLESYYKIDEASRKVNVIYQSFYSFPCLYLENKLSRKSTFSEEPSTEMNEYELMNPFARYGGYFQELTKHTTVFGYAEAHHVTDPGFQGLSAAFSLISNIGTSSIPFAEFLNHGILSIPGVISTSRLEWTDIWGRKWGQNLRSVYPDLPVLPPVPLNFIMTTTFELITNTKNPKDQQRVIEWQSDESVYIRVQMKMKNTYKLYWEPTICLQNQIPIIKETNIDYRNPIFIDDEYVHRVDSSLGDIWDVNLGFSSHYGICYNEDSYIAGKKLNSNIIEKMREMKTCADSGDPQKMTECSKHATELGLPVVERKPSSAKDEDDESPNKTWNYSPLIEDYLPEGYIYDKGMWQLNMAEYSDSAFYKGYPFHLDDCIPNFDNDIEKPHDIIAFPIFKGLGYNITYSSNYSLYNFSDYKGWWSDQLQNKDHTLLAGQQKVNKIAVGQESLLKDSEWINGFDLKQKEENQDLIDKRLKNLYVCLFNRHRVKITPGQSKYAFLKNVYQNNVVPILPNLTDKDTRYNEFECKEDSYQYSIKNISEIDNRVYTGNDRDWLYFAAGLRSFAKEDINVIMKLDPMESSKFEGITKVQDGGRFTYWQPPDGPNSYQYYDGNVNTVIGKRVDLTIKGKLYPTGINTFNTYLFELFEIEDEKETKRTYNMNTYMNSHGYGDSTTTVYVGGIDATSCRVEPGTFTYVKIVFYNNAGFDWKMKKGAITLNYTSNNIYLNGMDIMLDRITAVQYPSEYKFMSYEIPEEIKPYITLTPSQHVMDVSPQFFDLTFNNILTIRDALEGDYYYCLNVSKDFPEEYEGKLWEIKMKLNEEWFETFPSENDVTGIHNYHLTIPSIRFGVPIRNGENKGKIFYNLGQAKNLVYTFRLYNEFEIQGIKLINESILEQINTAIQADEDKFTKLLELWDQIPDNKDISDKTKITLAPLNGIPFYNLVTVNLTDSIQLFPYEEAPNKPYITKLYLLLKSYSLHSPYGNRNLMAVSTINYNDGRKNKKYTDSTYLNIYSSGPHLAPLFEHKVAEMNETTLEFEVTDNQEIYNGDILTIKLTLTSNNEGTSSAYNANFNLKIDKNAEYIETAQTTKAITVTEGKIQGDEKLINVFYKGEITSKSSIKCDLYFKMQIGEKREQINLNGEENRRRVLADSKTIKTPLVKELDMSLCLIDKECKEGDINYGKQKSSVKHDISYQINVVRDVGKIYLDAKNIGTDKAPKYSLTARVNISEVQSGYDLKNVIYIFYRKIEGLDDDYKEISTGKENSIIDEPFSNMKDIKNYKVSYKVIGKFQNGRTLDSTNQENLFNDEYEEKKNKGFPDYAIAIIVVLGVAAIAASGFLVYKLLTKKSIETVAISASENPQIIKKFDAGNELQTIDPTSGRRKRTIQNKSVISVMNNNNNANNIIQ